MASGSREVCKEFAGRSCACRNGGHAGIPIGFGNPRDESRLVPTTHGRVPIGSAGKSRSVPGRNNEEKITDRVTERLDQPKSTLAHSHLPCFPRPSTLPAMAKTKQTAKKSTGDTAKRQLIGVSTRVLRPRPSRSRGPSHSPQPIGDVEMTEKPTLGE